MLSKQFRLTKEKDFENAFKKGDAFFTKILGIKYIKNSLDDSRFGIIVGKKISKKATSRNKIKRQIREILRLQVSQIKAGYDIIIITRDSIINSDYWEIEKNIEYTFKKTGLSNSPK